MADPKADLPIGKLDARIEVLEKDNAELKASLKKLRAVTEDFLAKWGTYYTSEGRPSLMHVSELVQGGANGTVLTYHVGTGSHEVSAIPMGNPKTLLHPAPCWEPLIIPEKTIESIEEFDAPEGSGDGADSKAVA